MKRLCLIIIFIIATFIPLGGCDSIDENDPREALFNGVAFSETGNSDVPAIAVHENGEWYGVLNDRSGDGIAGAVYGDGNGNRFAVYLGEDGNPEKAYSQGYIFLFRNYRPGLVDVAVISPDGDIEIERGVEVDDSQLNRLTAETQNLSLQAAAGAQIGPFRLAAIGLSTAGCVTAIIMSAGLALPCGAAVVGVGLALVPSDDPRVQGSANGVTIGGAAIGCGTFEPVACFTLIAEIAAAFEEAFEAEEEEKAQEVAAAEGALESGSGDVQVTLTWDAAVDLDLWVTDPFGERIYFANRRSASGGQLDRDVISGFGPENIFWPPGEAPSGEYFVQVDHYSGGQSTNFTVLVQAFGHVRSYEGRIFPNETVDVTTFSDTGVANVIGKTVSSSTTTRSSVAKY